MSAAEQRATAERLAASIDGVVQGVGFRPFVARLAADLDLAGFVRNDADGAYLEVEGPRDRLARFAEALPHVPAPAVVGSIRWRSLPAKGERHPFEMRASETTAGRYLAMPPDLAPCAACREEVADLDARRHAYPFTNCARCGPRFSITEALPYDRARTSMAAFAMCAACRVEYDDPADRRYHAQPIACPDCGPRLRLLGHGEARVSEGQQALQGGIAALRGGAILALRGVGGYQLLADATREDVVSRLRQRKRRREQPFALLVDGLEAAEALCDLCDSEREALRGPAAPILLARRRTRSGRTTLASSVAPGAPHLGVMLPASPLHAMLARAFGRPLVCTSGNIHGDPIETTEEGALARLASVADLFLSHDRPIAHACDDSVVHYVDGRIRTLRLGRGLGPIEFSIGEASERVLLAVGTHLKNAPAIAHRGRALLWPHVGDLHGPRGRAALGRVVAEMQVLVGASANVVVRDAHPDYGSTRLAQELGRPRIAVQHHHAHAAACLAEHGVERALAFAWDGSGYGDDGSSWGGEVLSVDGGQMTRVGHVAPFSLVGGEAAARDGRRALAGLLVEAGLAGDPVLGRLDSAALSSFCDLATKPRISTRCTSVGRLFDAVAALLGLVERSTFEGQAAVALEAAARPGAQRYDLGGPSQTLDVGRLMRSLVVDMHDTERAASRFHATLVGWAVDRAQAASADTVALVGGCFANRILAEQLAGALRERGIRVLLPERVPPGDGGVALGQVWVAARTKMEDR